MPADPVATPDSEQPCAPLLKLPFEIRSTIWRLVLGDRIVVLNFINRPRRPKKVGDWANLDAGEDVPESDITVPTFRVNQPAFWGLLLCCRSV